MDDLPASSGLRILCRAAKSMLGLRVLCRAVKSMTLIDESVCRIDFTHEIGIKDIYNYNDCYEISSFYIR